MDIDVYNKYVGEWGIELWSPDAPNLYTLKISILDEDDNCKDEVESYFGMRDIRIRNGLVLLNGQPLYQRLVLDQGYWKDTGLTPENDDVLLKDIEYVKRMGFNGVRKHQKTESDRFCTGVMCTDFLFGEKVHLSINILIKLRKILRESGLRLLSKIIITPALSYGLR